MINFMIKLIMEIQNFIYGLLGYIAMYQTRRCYCTQYWKFI